MFEVKDGRIKITKGDSAALKVTLTMANGTAYTMQDGDSLTLTARKAPGADMLIEIVSDTDTITFSPTDTEDLTAGEYCFDIQLETADGDIFTVVGMNTGTLTNMTILPEITE